MQNIGEKIYKLRGRERLTQDDLAEILDVTRQTISNWETERAKPDLEKIVMMCERFNLSTDEFLLDRPPAGSTLGKEATEQSQTEQSQTEQSQTERSQIERSQIVERSQIEQLQTEKSQTERLQIVEKSHSSNEPRITKRRLIIFTVIAAISMVVLAVMSVIILAVDTQTATANFLTVEVSLFVGLLIGSGLFGIVLIALLVLIFTNKKK